MAERKKTVRLLLSQKLKIVDHIRGNEGAYRGMTATDVARLITNELGFDVSVQNLLYIQKEAGLSICPKTRRMVRRDDIKAVARFACQLASFVSYDIPEEIIKIAK